MTTGLIRYRSTQRFTTVADIHQNNVERLLSTFEITLDCQRDSPPFQFTIIDKLVDSLSIVGSDAARTIGCDIRIAVHDKPAFHRLMEEEDWADRTPHDYPKGSGYRLDYAVNYWICDTCIAPDGMEWVGERCQFEIVEEQDFETSSTS